MKPICCGIFPFDSAAPLFRAWRVAYLLLAPVSRVHIVFGLHMPIRLSSGVQMNGGTTKPHACWE